MKAFLDSYSLDDACEDAIGLDLFNNPYDFYAFCDAVIRYLRLAIRSECGVDLLSLWQRGEISDYLRSVLQRHPGIDTDMAVIVCASALRTQVVKVLNDSSRRPAQSNE